MQKKVLALVMVLALVLCMILVLYGQIKEFFF